MVKCPNCGGETHYEPKEKKVVCDDCNSKFTAAELRTIIKAASEENRKNNPTGEGTNYLEAQGYTCSQCGATLLVFDETAVTFCNYCGSNALIESKLMRITHPDYIIPFKITKEEAIKNYKKKISHSLFVPKELKSDTVISKFRGIYMPYCVYDIGYDGEVTSTGSVKYLHLFGYDYYHDYKVDAKIKTNYKGLSYDLASKYYDKYSMSIPFDFKDIEPFNINYMSGYYADARDVDLDTYDTDAKKIISNDARDKLSLKKGRTFASHGCSVPHIHMGVKERTIGMFPVYFLANVNKEKNIVHYAVVNGQTGKVTMDMPIDYKKYIVLSLILTIPIFLLLNWRFLVRPYTVTLIGIFFSVISLLISKKQIRDLWEHQNHTEDLGYRQRGENQIPRMRFAERFRKYTWKQTLGILISVAVLFSGTIEDSLYYGAALLSLLLVLFAFNDLVKEHNALSSSKLPQLEKRGGDENA